MDRNLKVRIGKKDKDIDDMLSRFLTQSRDLDTSKLVKTALRAVLPHLLDEAGTLEEVRAIDSRTKRQICGLREAAKDSGHDLLTVLGQLESEMRRTPVGTVHGPVQFRPADEADEQRRIKERVLDAAAILNRIADSICT